VTHRSIDTAGRADAPRSLLFIHGPGLDRGCFRPFVDPLGDVARLVFMDLPLSGRARSPVATPVDLMAMVNAAVDAARDHGRGKVVPVGHSWGALIALAVALKLPSAVPGVVFVAQSCSPTFGPTLLDYVARAGNPSQQEAISKAFAGALITDDEFEAAWRAILPLYLHDAEPVLMRDLFANVSFSAAAFNAFVANAVGRMSFHDELRHLQVPALFIAGGSDWCERDPAGGSPAAATLAPRGPCVVLEESGHFPFAEQPEQFCVALRSWLTGVS
jgi:proline iminopeptidase